MQKPPIIVQTRPYFPINCPKKVRDFNPCWPYRRAGILIYRDVAGVEAPLQFIVGEFWMKMAKQVGADAQN